MADFFRFSDEQWARIEPLLPQDTRGMPWADDRRVLSGIVHALKSGGRWGACPEHVYGPKKTHHNRFRRWAERGVWDAGIPPQPSVTALFARTNLPFKFFARMRSWTLSTTVCRRVDWVCSCCSATLR